METFGEWIRGQRDARRLTREEFASRVGCSVAMLRKIEDGERRPSAQIAELIAKTLDIPPDERGTFVKVARGVLSTERLAPVPKLLHPPNIPPTQTLSRTNLPILPTPLIGRQFEVEQLTKLLNDPQCRMLTIVGAGGIGKTRLAIEAASQRQDDFTDGVYFVPLAAVSAQRFIVPVIADSIGFLFQGDRSIDPKAQLFNYLSEKKILLVLDNLEQLLDDATVVHLFAELVEKTTKVKLLLTSRESLQLQGEWVFEVHGLPIPESRDVEGTSVELFLQRARRAYVGFDATTDDYPAIVRICQLVDGMPLGIELAAAWVRTLSCNEIAAEIQRGLDFLSVPVKDVPARHRSMRAVFNHSWELLSNEEQNVLLALSVFQGGFSREAAQQVAGATLPMLSALVTKSLIRRSASGRFDQHELVRQFANARLQEDALKAKTMLDQHGAFFMTLLQQTEPRLKSAEQQNALLHLGAEVDNLRLAWNWAVQNKKLSDLRKAAPCLQWLYDLRGWLHEGASMIKQATESLKSENRSEKTSPELFATLNVLAIYEGLANVRSGKVGQGRALLQNILETTRRHSDPKGLSDNLAFLGLADYLSGNYDEAQIHLTEALEVSRSISYDWITSFSLMIFGMVAQMRGEFDSAETCFREGLALGRLIGSPRNVGSFLIIYSALLNTRNRYQEAREMLLESLSIGRAERDQWLIAISLQHLSAMAHSLQETEDPESQKMMEESVTLFRDLGDRWGLAMSLMHLGEIFSVRGQYDAARQYLFEAVQTSAEAHVTPVTLDAMVSLAALYQREGKYEAAVELLNIVLRQAGISQETFKRAETINGELGEKFSSNEYEQVHTSLKSKTVESVVKEILGELQR